MPGFIDWKLNRRCPDCGALSDEFIKGAYYHKPTCPTQPGHEEAQRIEDERRANRRAFLDALPGSREAKRLRRLRSIGRVGA